MNKDYMYLEDRVIVTSHDGSITHHENSSNIKEVLEVENKIEGLENDVINTKARINHCNNLKKNMKKFARLSVVLWPIILITSYKISSLPVNSIKDFIILGVAYPGFSLALASVGNYFNNKDIQNFKELLVKQNHELENNKQLLNELDLNKSNSNSIQDEKTHKLDLQQLKEYRAKIIAEHYFQTNKEKIMKLVDSGKLRKKCLLIVITMNKFIRNLKISPNVNGIK